MFNDMIGSIEFDVTRLMMKAQIHKQERPRTERAISTTATRNISAKAPNMPDNADLSNVKRNDPCPELKYILSPEQEEAGGFVSITCKVVGDQHEIVPPEKATQGYQVLNIAVGKVFA